MSKLIPSIRNLKRAWKSYRNCLDGVFCIYKPTEMTTGAVSAILKTKILNGNHSFHQLLHTSSEIISDIFPTVMINFGYLSDFKN